MPKSKNRKGHAKKSAERTLILKRKKEKAQREFMDMIRGMQQKQFEEQKVDVLNADDLGNIGDDLQLDTEDIAVDINLDDQK